MFRLPATLVLLSVSFLAQGQVDNPHWQTATDFKKAEDKVKETILWLEENPLATVSNDTKAMTEYVLTWLTNVPYLEVKYDELFLESLSDSKRYKFGEKFRVTYLFGKSYYVINHQAEADEAEAIARGIKGMVKVYQELKKIDPSVKHRVLEKYERLEKTGKTLGYVRNQLSKTVAEGTTY